MRAYSTDLRERVVTACEATREVAARFSASVTWIRKLIRQRRETGSIAPRPRGSGRVPAFDVEAARRLREAVRADDDPLAELARAAGVSCGASAVHRALTRLGITRKESRGGRPSRIDRS